MVVQLPERLSEPVVVCTTATLPQRSYASGGADNLDGRGGKVLAHLVVVWRLDVVDLANVAAIYGLRFGVRSIGFRVCAYHRV
jgi:hypothetical protein